MPYTPGQRVNPGTPTEATKAGSLNELLNTLADNVTFSISAEDLRNSVFTLYDNTITKPSEGEAGQLLRVVGPGVYEFATLSGGLAGNINPGTATNIAFYSTGGQEIDDVSSVHWDGTDLIVDNGIVSQSLIVEELIMTSIAPMGPSGASGATGMTGASGPSASLLRNLVMIDENGVFSSTSSIVLPPPILASGATGNIQFNNGVGTFSSSNELNWDIGANRLGIGNPPLHKLDINGDIRVGDLAGSGSKMVVTDNNGVLGVQNIVTSTGAINLVQLSDGSGGLVGGNVFNPSGDLGIGISSPEAKLHVSAGIDNLLYHGDLSGHLVISVTASGGYYRGIVIKNDAGADAAHFGVFGSGANITHSYWNIGPKDTTGVQSNSNGMVLKTDGKVGIGTTSPLDKLHVTGIGRFGSSSTGGGVFLQQEYSVTNIINSLSSHYSSAAFIIGQKVAGKVGANGYVATQANVSSTPGLLEIDSGKLSFKNADNALYTTGEDITTMKTHFFINQLGNIGIGTVNPSARLHIKTDGGEALRLDSSLTSGAEGQVYMSFYDYDEVGRKAFLGFGSGANNTLTIQNDVSGGALNLSTNAAIRLSINSAGFVGIGTTLPGSKLHVVGDTKSDTFIQNAIPHQSNTFGAGVPLILNRIGAFRANDEWMRCIQINHRSAYEVTVWTTGGSYTPGHVTFHVQTGWTLAGFYVDVISKSGAEYVSDIRFTSVVEGSGGGYLEIKGINSSKLTYQINVSVRPLTYSLYSIDGNTSLNLASLGFITAELAL